MRVQKYLSECGVASRRKADELIKAGKVKVDGQVAVLGQSIDPSKNKIEINGQHVGQKEAKVYIKLYKPRGYVSSCQAQKEQKTVLDLVKDLPYRLYPVGRLDKDSEGLMILTNDGEFANKMMHPRYQHEKEYEVTTQLTINNEQLTTMKKGIIIEGKKTLPAKVSRLADKKFRIVLKEGKKRQIRKMIETVGSRVVRLKRVRMGNIKLGKLIRPGDYEIINWRIYAEDQA